MKYLRSVAVISAVLLIAVAVARSFNRFIPAVNNTTIAIVDLCLVALAVEVIAECARMPGRTKGWRIGRAIAIIAAVVVSGVIGFLALLWSAFEGDGGGSFTKDGETYYVMRTFPDNVVMYRKTSPVTMAESAFADDSGHALGFVPMPVALSISLDEYGGEYSQILADVRRDHPDWLTDR